MRRSVWRAAALSVAAVAIGSIALVTISSPANAAQPLAKATLRDTAGVVVGEVVFLGPGKYTDRVEVTILAPAAPNLGDFHGFHVHTTGICNPEPSGTSMVPFGSAGSHWNPGGTNHGDHAGDMPSQLITAEGEAFTTFETDRFDVLSLIDSAGDGSAVILHFLPDNFANIPAVYGEPNATTLATGDAGGRYACGVVKATR